MDVLAALHALAQQADENAQDLRTKLELVLNQYQGLTLKDPQDLRRFKIIFDRVAKGANAQPSFSDGSPGSLQVRTNNYGNTYSAIVRRGRCEYTGAPANTIPNISLTPNH